MTTLRWRGWLVAAAVFLFGLAVGTACTLAVGGRLVRHALLAPVGARGFADRTANRIADDLTSSLSLTPAEASAVRSTLEESATRLKTIRARAALQAAVELRSSTERIAAQLPPEKRDAYFKLIAQRYTRLGLQPPTAPTPSAPAANSP